MHSAFENDILINFWDHIEEFRRTLLRILTIIGLGFLIVFAFYKPLFQILTASLQTQNAPFIRQILHKERIYNPLSDAINYQLPQGALLLAGSKAQQIDKDIYRIESNRYLEYEIAKDAVKLLIISPLEGILLTCKLSFWVSLALTSPIWIYFLLQFILPGLKKQEKEILLPFVFGSFISIGIGILLAYFISIPLANRYLIGFNSALGSNEWTLMHYIDYTLVLFAGHMVAVELCLLLIILVHFQYLSVSWLKAKRRYMFLGAFILGALLTPPDIPSQLMLAFPLVAIYEIAILYGKIRSKNRAT